MGCLYWIDGSTTFVMTNRMKMGYNIGWYKGVVLDEADRMLDMGFSEDMRRIMTHVTMRPEHQTLMFSATFPEEIQRMAGEFLKNYVFVAIGIVGGACSDVKQTIYEVNKYAKRSKLIVSGPTY